MDWFWIPQNGHQIRVDMIFVKRQNRLRYTPQLLYSREALICVRHRTGARKVAGRQFRDLKTGRFDKVIDLAIQMATSCNVLPNRSEPVLPGADTTFGCAAVFQKDELAAGSQRSFYLP